MSDNKILEFTTKNAIILSGITFTVGSQMRSLSAAIVNSLVDPLFSIDIDNNGVPDLKQMKGYATNVLGIKFPFGILILELLRTIVTIILLYYTISFVVNKTNLVKL
jgi:hypothetical protein